MHKEYFEYIKTEQIKLLQTLEINSDEKKVELYNEQAKLLQLVLKVSWEISSAIKEPTEENFKTLYIPDQNETDFQRLYLKQDWSIKKMKKILRMIIQEKYQQSINLSVF